MEFIYINIFTKKKRRDEPRHTEMLVIVLYIIIIISRALFYVCSECSMSERERVFFNICDSLTQLFGFFFLVFTMTKKWTKNTDSMYMYEICGLIGVELFGGLEKKG